MGAWATAYHQQHPGVSFTTAGTGSTARGPAMLTPQQAASAVASAVAERDTIQQNLLDLDGSFGKRLLSGATLTGETKRRWDIATADLTRLWEIFTAYSAGVGRAAEMLPGARRAAGRVLSDITAIFNAPSVRLPGGSSAVAQGNITGTAEQVVGIDAAVREMRRLFAGMADVVNAAKTVWNALADQLQQVAGDLGAPGPRRARLDLPGHGPSPRQPLGRAQGPAQQQRRRRLDGLRSRVGQRHAGQRQRDSRRVAGAPA
jgi:hypothetical protein